MDNKLLEDILKYADSLDPVYGTARNPRDYCSLTLWTHIKNREKYNVLQAKSNKQFGKFVIKVVEYAIAKAWEKYELAESKEPKAG